MIKIDYNVIRENVKKLNKQDYLVLKSNAYGFGLVEVLEIAIKCGIYKFCVIDLLDAIYIKTRYTDCRVLLLGVFDVADILNYEKYQIEVSINDLEEIELIKDYNLLVQIKINSGMNRFGILPIDITRCLNLLSDSNLTLTGIYSHNATKSITYIKEQLESFYYAIKDINDVDVHFSASSLYEETLPFLSMKRVGDIVYRNALSFYGKILKINYVEKGEFVGYDYAYKMKKNGYVGVIDIGYADGLERMCNGFLVYINNKYYYLIGKACMNYCFVLIDETINRNDTVHFISKYNNMTNYLNHFGKINHEVYLNLLCKK